MTPIPDDLSDAVWDSVTEQAARPTAPPTTCPRCEADAPDDPHPPVLSRLARG